MKIVYYYSTANWWARAHRADCAQIPRELLRERSASLIETDAETVRELVEEIAGDFIFANDERPWTDYLSSVSIAPCLSGELTGASPARGA